MFCAYFLKMRFFKHMLHSRLVWPDTELKMKLEKIKQINKLQMKTSNDLENVWRAVKDMKEVWQKNMTWRNQPVTESRRFFYVLH